ncbi:MAG: DUF4327 family protein [Oscillatoriales cyanobacterium SM2_2_1]|nr:DUF4327 family protein [Oscillatoriales cyanobacterium SM2_2_1]
MVQLLQISIEAIRDEARHLLECGTVRRNEQILSLCRFYGDRDWNVVEHELELHQYLLRDQISDLLGQENWSDD